MKGIYTMEPITTNKVSNNECDVKYKYNPAPGSSKTDKGEDKRRFTFTPTNSCPNTWNVTSMGAHHSGTTL